MAISNFNKYDQISVLIHGVKKGIKVSTVSTFLTWVIIIIIIYIPFFTTEVNDSDPIDPFTILIFLFLITIIISVFLGAVGGVINSWILIQLIKKDRFSIKSSTISGLLVGLVMGLLIIAVIVFTSGCSLFKEDIILILLIACIAVLSGGYQGRSFFKWIESQVADQTYDKLFK